MTDKAPHTVQPYIDAIGVHPTVQLLLTFGGGTIYVAVNPGPDSAVAKAIGLERARDLGKAFGRGHVRVPLAKDWLARQLFDAGWPKGKIARHMHVSDETIRQYLLGIEKSAQSPSQSLQLDLFR